MLSPPASTFNFPLLLPAAPSPTPPTSLLLLLPSAPPRRAALLFVGLPGYMLPNRADPLSTRAAALAFASVKRHVIDHNAPAWEVTTFFHTWAEAAALEAELVALYAPAAHAVGPGLDAHGALRNSSQPSSIEIGLSLLRRHEDAQGGAFDAVLVLRFDAIFFQPFDFEQLSDPAALYVASWCLASQGRPWRAAPGGALCKNLTINHSDLRQGLPDFYFAGSSAYLWRFFGGLVADLEAGRLTKTGAPMKHAILGGRLRQLPDTRMRRYLIHQQDVGVVRMINECAPSHMECLAEGKSWGGGRARGEGTPAAAGPPTVWPHGWGTSSGSSSVCGRGEAFFCACEEAEFACQAFVR